MQRRRRKRGWGSIKLKQRKEQFSRRLISRKNRYRKIRYILIFRITLQISNNSELIFQAHLQLILDWRIILVRIIRQHTRQVIIIRQPTVRVTTPKLTVQRLAKLDCAKILTSSTTTSVDLDRVMDRLS